MEKEMKKVPAVRFKGFTGDWEQRKLGEIADKVTSKNKEQKYKETLTNSAEQGIVSQKEYFDHSISNIENINGYYVVEDNDFVYNPRISTSAPVGPINRNKLGRTGVMSPLYTVFKPHEIDESYLEWFFKSSHWYKFMYLNGDTGARSDRFAIKDSVFFKMPIPVPIFEEQYKVGNFLNEADRLLTLHQQKLDQLKKLKAYFLQNLFPAKGEKVPKIRFKGFTGEWEERKLEEIGKIITGNTPSTNHSEYYSKDGIPWITPTDIFTNTISESAKKLSKQGEKFGRVVPAGTILVTCIASIGKNTMLLKRGSFNQQINGLVPNQDRFDSYFLLTESEFWSKRMKTEAAAGTMQIVNKKDFSSIKTYTPSLTEQQSIGHFFSKIDSLITHHQRKLVQLQAVKKFLLQNLFV